MNSDKFSLSGWLHVYTLFLIALIVSPFIPIVSFFSSIPLILIPFYIVSLIFIYKRNKYESVVNKITLIITIFFQIFNLYMLSVSNSEAPKSIFILVIMSNIATLVISSVFLGYWQKSKKINNISTNSTTIAQTPTSLSAEKLETSMAGVQVNSHLNAGHLAILAIVSLLSCSIFIYTGWGFLFAVPASLVFSIFYSVIFTKELKKNNANAFAVYSVTFTLVFAYASILLNIGIISDSKYIVYLAPSLLGVPSTTFAQTFNYLLNISFLYLFLSILVNLSLIKKNTRKSLFILVPVVGLILIVIHWGIILQQLPELKAQVFKEKQEELQKEKAKIEEGYAFNWSKITEDTLKNRIYSIFTPPEPSIETPISQCPYTTYMIRQNLTQGGINFSCLNDSLKSIGQLPITEKKVVGVSFPNLNGFFNKGDILAVVAELESPSMMRIHANGNAAKDCACRMYPYDYSGIDDYIKTGTSTGVYERSVIQMQVTDKKRTVMILYPININNLKDINIKLSQFSDNPNVPVTLREVAVLSPTTLSPDPEWLKKWFKEPNPFLDK